MHRTRRINGVRARVAAIGAAAPVRSWGRERSQRLVQRRQPALLHPIDAAFLDQERALPVIAAIEHHQEFVFCEDAEHLLAVREFAQKPHSQDVDRPSASWR